MLKLPQKPVRRNNLRIIAFQASPGGFSPADHVPWELEVKPRRTRRTSSGDCRPGIPRLLINSLAIRDVSWSRKVGVALISASKTLSTWSLVSPFATKISISSVHPTRPADCSMMATTRPHRLQTLRRTPVLARQYLQRIDKKSAQVAAPAPLRASENQARFKEGYMGLAKAASRACATS